MPYPGLIGAISWFDMCHILVMLGLKRKLLHGIIAEHIKGDFEVHLGIFLVLVWQDPEP